MFGKLLYCKSTLRKWKNYADEPTDKLGTDVHYLPTYIGVWSDRPTQKTGVREDEPSSQESLSSVLVYQSQTHAALWLIFNKLKCSIDETWWENMVRIIPRRPIKFWTFGPGYKTGKSCFPNVLQNGDTIIKLYRKMSFLRNIRNGAWQCALLVWLDLVEACAVDRNNNLSKSASSPSSWASAKLCIIVWHRIRTFQLWHLSSVSLVCLTKKLIFCHRLTLTHAPSGNFPI